jgi:predicted amidophosphoribosyltransferase
MSPRILEVERCPHCTAHLTPPNSRLCPACGGSLQRRYLTAGCLTSAPKLLIAAAALGWALAKLAGLGAG